MTVSLVTFSDTSMIRAAELCVESAHRHGTDKTIYWKHRAFMQTELYHDNDPLLSNPRGLGFWAWKPWIIWDALTNDDHSERKEGDVLCYADAGVEFIENINYIIDRMDQDVFLFGNMYEHAHWCKRDIIEAIFPSDNPPFMSHKRWAEFGKQVQASVIFFRVNDRTRAFVKEWLDWCLFESGRLIDDSPSKTPNHPEFQENRHDQAILTTMAYRDGYILHWWPAVYNDGAFIYPRGDYPDLGHPALFHHHRGVKTGERAA